MSGRNAPRAAARPWVIALLVASKVERLDHGSYRLHKTVQALRVGSTDSPPPKEMPPLRFPADILVQLAAGRAVGPHLLRLTVERPDGTRQHLWEEAVEFDDALRTFSSVTNAVLEVMLPGTYWFELWSGDDLLTRSPLTMVYDPAPLPRRRAKGDPPPSVKTRVN